MLSRDLSIVKNNALFRVKFVSLKSCLCKRNKIFKSGKFSFLVILI